MLLSMTGFGRGEFLCPDGNRLTVQVSSVNRKQLEIRFSLPTEFAVWETAGRKMVSAAISRGAVQIRCSLNSTGTPRKAVNVDSQLLDKLIRESRAARVRANLSGDVAVETLMLLPGVLDYSGDDNGADELSSGFEKALAAALADFRLMREKEGLNLAGDLLERLEKLEKWHSQLAEMTAGYPALAKERIMARLSEEKLPVDGNDPGVMREVLFYVDKGDVTEELTRLSSHFGQFRAFLQSNEPVGRNLDFLAQEMFREITTLGNKAAVSGASSLVVAFKAEMEKIREQIQNIE